MAVYAGDNEIKEIGPIRSARPYFLDWAKEYDSLFVHCGGSPEALALIAKSDVLDINEFYNGNYFWRDSSRRSFWFCLVCSRKNGRHCFCEDSLESISKYLVDNPTNPTLEIILFSLDGVFRVEMGDATRKGCSRNQTSCRHRKKPQNNGKCVQWPVHMGWPKPV